MHYKLICIDMDGTLLNGDHIITENTKKILKKAHDFGAHIVISTGRIYSSAEYYSNLIGVNSAVISSNGSFIKEKNIDEPIYKSTLSEDLCMKVVETCARNKTGVSFYSVDKLYCGSIVMIFLHLFLKLKKIDNLEVDKEYVFSLKRWKEVLKKGNSMIKCEIMSKDHKKLSKIRSELNKIDGLEVVSSYKNNIEVSMKGVSKGSAVEIIAKHYNVKQEEIIAIGDNENDISMIKYAGLGIAMGNALDIVKENANCVTDTNDNEGVAKAIQKFVLK